MWFQEAVAHRPERSVTRVEGCDIETLAWGKVGNPGLMLLHGNGAHADWWSFIAPLLMAQYRVATISFSGMGASGWREEYSPSVYAREALAAAKNCGLFKSSEKPVFAAHSFGGVPLLYLASRPERFLKAAILIDTVMGVPDPSMVPPPRTRPNPIYPDLATALSRFRFAPVQPCPNPFIVDHIARAALRASNGQGGGWTWRFDPFTNQKFKWPADRSWLSASLCPVAVFWGARSSLFLGACAAAMFDLLAHDAPRIEIPDAGHHVLADQPLALVSALQALLSVWPSPGPMSTITMT